MDTSVSPMRARGANGRPLYRGKKDALSISFDVLLFSVCAELIRNFCKATEPKELHRFRFSAVYMRNTIQASRVGLLTYSFIRVY